MSLARAAKYCEVCSSEGELSPRDLCSIEISHSEWREKAMIALEEERAYQTARAQSTSMEEACDGFGSLSHRGVLIQADELLDKCSFCNRDSSLIYSKFNELKERDEE